MSNVLRIMQRVKQSKGTIVFCTLRSKQNAEIQSVFLIFYKWANDGV